MSWARQAAWLRSPALAAAFLVGALAALAWAGWREAASLGAAAAALAARPGFAFVALAGYLGFIALLALQWRALVLRLGGGPLDLRTTAAVQATAWSARYLPGKVGFTAAKVLLMPGDRVAAAWAVAYEQVLILAAGVAVVAACAPVALGLDAALGGGPLVAPLAALAVLLLAAYGLARTTPWLDRAIAARLAGAAPRAHPGARELGLRLVGFALAHGAVGLGFVALLHALGHGAAIAPLHAIGALTAAHLGGIVAVFAPAGLGVREVLLASLLAPALGLPDATAVALITRAGATLGDLLVAPLALLGRGPGWRAPPG